VTLSLRAWRYGSRESARHPEDPVGRLTAAARREAHRPDGTSPSALQRWDASLPASWPPTGWDVMARLWRSPLTEGARAAAGTKRA
jgi:hypothetical protein